MKKFMKRAVSGAICLTVASGVALSTACRREEGEARDPNRIQIECAIADVGMGTEWLYNLKSRFEADYPKAQVMVNIVTTEVESTSIATTLSSSNYDIAFANDGVAAIEGLEASAMDVTSIVQKKAYDENGNYVKEGGTKSLEDRMSKYEGYLDAIAIQKNGQNRYISMPYYMTPYGCWYDVDLFESEGYFDLDYKGVDGIAGTDDDTWGADGVEGTYDDNLPATFEDYKTLITTIAADGLTPFTWSGVHGWMRTFYLYVVYMNYEGKDEYALNWTLNGFDSQEGIGQITPQDSYKIMDQDGKKAALKMAEFMTSNPNFFSGDAFKSSQTHLEAQRDFLGSAQRTGSKRIAMILDGAWWENEAKSYMNEMAAEKGEKYAHGKRRFGYLPVPRFEADASIGMAAQTNTKTVLSVGKGADFVVNKKVENASAEKKEMVEEFLLYMQSYESLKDFTTTTGVVRPIESYFTADDVSNFTYMAQQVYELLNTCDLWIPTLAMTSNATKCKIGDSKFFDSIVSGTTVTTEPMLLFAESNYTVKDYLNGTKKAITESDWYASVLR